MILLKNLFIQARSSVTIRVNILNNKVYKVLDTQKMQYKKTRHINKFS